MRTSFLNIEEKKAYRKLEKLHWRVLQLHKIRMQDDDCYFNRAEKINEQIDDLQQEIDSLVSTIRRDDGRGRIPWLRKVC